MSRSRSRSRSPERPADDTASPTRSPPPTRFRFKRRSHSPTPSDPRKRHKSHHTRRHHHHRHHRTAPAPAAPPLDPDAAFRESLFDAMADDEGAAYWEGVYGQPIHTYAAAAEGAAAASGRGVDAMTDDEYVAYVRARMWEKTHEHVLEERAARDEARRRRGEARARALEEEEGLRARMEESMRRGKERREGRRAREGWERYRAGWEEVRRGVVRTVPWPTASGRQEDVGEEAVGEFFRRAPVVGGEGPGALRALIKAERVNWHPDKMQQRFGGRLTDGQVRSVTAVFQVIDGMWDGLKNG